MPSVPLPRRSVPACPFVALLAAGALVALAAVPAGAAAADGPLTFDQAKAQGKQVDWGPNCDTTTGQGRGAERLRTAVREPWTGGNNGGDTAPGVTADTITVALYQAQPDLLQQAFFEDTGSDESLAKERDTTQEYVDYFSAHYELYGRKVKLVTIKASGAPDDDVAAKADAIKVATEVHAFASFGGPGQTTAYAEELAARGVLCVGDCVIAEPQSFLDRHAPVRVAHDRVARAGERALGGVRRQAARQGQGRARGRRGAASRSRGVFGVVHYDDDAGTFAKSVDALRATAGALPA